MGTIYEWKSCTFHRSDIYIKKKKERTQISQILAVKFFCLGILFITLPSTFAYGNIKYASRQTNSASFATAKAPLVLFSFLFFISCFLFFLMPARLNADASTSQSVSLLLKIWRCTENPCNHFHLEMHDLHARDDKYYQSTTMRRSYVHYSHARKTGFIDSIGPASEIFAIFYYAEICYRLCRIVARVFVCFHVDTYISTQALVSRCVLVYIYRLAKVFEHS